MVVGNDGFLTCEERVNTWGITFEEFFLWVSTDLPGTHLLVCQVEKLGPMDGRSSHVL